MTLLDRLRLLAARIHEPGQKPPDEGDPPAEEHVPPEATDEDDG